MIASMRSLVLLGITAALVLGCAKPRTSPIQLSLPADWQQSFASEGGQGSHLALTEDGLLTLHPSPGGVSARMMKRSLIRMRHLSLATFPSDIPDEVQAILPDVVASFRSATVKRLKGTVWDGYYLLAARDDYTTAHFCIDFDGEVWFGFFAGPSVRWAEAFSALGSVRWVGGR